MIDTFIGVAPHGAKIGSPLMLVNVSQIVCARLNSQGITEIELSNGRIHPIAQDLGYVAAAIHDSQNSAMEAIFENIVRMAAVCKNH